jgi:glycosyltransferase involved in cell wall biosynthesis
MRAQHPGYAVVTPVRDEAPYILRTLESVDGQTLQPLRWIVVDDGSTDGTGAILDEFARTRDWIRIVHRPDRGRRASGGGVMEAFHAGLEQLADVRWDFLAKLDGDLSFEPQYFELCLARFDAEPQLGIGGGTVCAFVDGRLEVESAGDPPFHVRGATKIYRRRCFEQIAPLIEAPGWDTLDEVRANRFGWTTRTFADLPVLQHKPTGSADGCWRNAFKNGRANYFTGYHPAFMMAKCFKRLRREPYGVESAGLLAGYLSACLKRMAPLADAATVRYLRGQQMRRLLHQDSIYGPAETAWHAMGRTRSDLSPHR